MMDKTHIHCNNATRPEADLDLDLHDFISQSNIDQILELIGGGEIADPVADFCNGYVDIGQQLMIQEDVDHLMNVEIQSQFNEHGLAAAPQGIDLFGTAGGDIVIGQSEDHFNQYMDEPMPNTNILGVVDCPRDEEEDDDEDGDDDDNISSGTTTTTTTTTPKKGKVDRSRTLLSERRRRGRMKENLYALRSLVPNITKMDKASIVGDAVLYVQKLQAKAKRLKVEILEHEASATSQGPGAKPRKSQVVTSNNIFTHSVTRYITKMDLFQVGDKEFYIKLVSNKGEGTATSLHKAIESIDGLNVRSSNLSACPDNFILTLTVEARECGRDMNLASLKSWLFEALTCQGFLLKLST